MPSSKPKKAAAPQKPKRPLSGYNLYYRYKRNRVLAASSRLHLAQSTSGLSDEQARAEEARTIAAVLAAVPGMEGVPPDHVLWSASAEELNELRGATIRREMEGKLLPNDRARERQHRKVHGMGFVEMGRVMRDTWTAADDYTKRVFMELAEIGRVEYKKLLEEYKRKEEEEAKKTNPPPPPQVQEAPKKKLKKGASSSVEQGKVESELLRRAASLPMVTPQTFMKEVNQNAFALAAASFPPPPVYSQPIFNQLPASPVPSPTGCMSYNLLHQSLPLPPPPFPVPPMQYERRVSSSGSSPSSHSPIEAPLSPSPMEASPSDVSDHMLADLEATNIDILSLIAGGILPPPPLGDPREAGREEPFFDPQAKQSVRNLEKGIGPDDLTIDLADREGDVSTADFLDFIGKLDSALDMDIDDEDEMWALNGSAKCVSQTPGLVFGKPVHDVPNHLTPMPGRIGNPNLELHNSRARMA